MRAKQYSQTNEMIDMNKIRKRNGIILAATVMLAGLAFNGLKAEQMAADNSANQGLAVATFAGGCFWCIESDLKTSWC